ncbi:hypothetical protein HanRHA438_Chr16g0735881 [Helianthus annuus]|uniref:Uncharacterized protein n=1 Tax=Helianthus annuus TaxID=4232 RepID=A0A9K3GWR1_HELAN|nr:hypothetical protein HanXRQr2_Chr16g0723231 [Helianthus annuus]KAJ0819228.1 hypothetical protein HanPSC8_Chr16g0693711 [Helianthus annuus]KAJ0833728.1 hypothetical protein HanRHA438_Chr16g0735881 [Helianthus annuus]
MLCITPAFSSSIVKGYPMNSASLFKWIVGSFFISSYFKKRIISGLSKLALQYPKI